MRAEVFFDTNLILYLLDEGPKADIAERVLQAGGVVSVQVLNEVLANSRRKAGMSWEEAGLFLSGIRRLCTVVDLTEEIHDVGRALGQRYGFSVYDAMIVSAALVSGCTELHTEDMHDGLLVEDVLRIVNPFVEKRP
ncbi:PIN domain-containing protein [Salinarimonas sp.]|uniref:PIN domain-containing protein n=1 Tax=Salinarimonas sp. TaxID=2766526 RepID=UPI0032D8E520